MKLKLTIPYSKFVSFVDVSLIYLLFLIKATGENNAMNKEKQEYYNLSEEK